MAPLKFEIQWTMINQLIKASKVTSRLDVRVLTMSKIQVQLVRDDVVQCARSNYPIRFLPVQVPISK